MQPRLRGMVMAVPTSDGLLFRMGESYLPVKGRQMFEFFNRVQPLLDGRHSLAQMVQDISRVQRRALVTMLKALRDAAMLYDAAGDTTVEEVPGGQHLPFVRRIETKSDRPFQKHAEIQKTRVLLLGCADMALAALESLLDSNLRNLSLCVPDWSAGVQSRIAEIALRCGGPETRVERLAWPTKEPWEGLLKAFDVVAMVGRSSVDRAWMEEVENAQASDAPPVIPLVVHGGHVLVGPVLTAGSIRRFHDLLNGYRLPAAAEASPALQESVGSAIGAALLAQRVFDFRAGMLQQEDLVAIQDVDLSSFEIRARPAPLPVSVSSKLLRGSARAGSHRGGSNGRATNQAVLDPEQFLERVDKCLVDSTSGLIHQFGEHNLYQIPHHQSAALWRLPGSKETVWTTEAGEDIVQSRFQVACRVLERYVSEMLMGESPRPGHSPHREASARNGHDHGKTMYGLVASALEPHFLRAQAYFRAVSQYAYAIDEWTDIPFERELIQGPAELTLGYLTDIGEAQWIRVARCQQLSSARHEVLRFSYRDKPVSVIAARVGPECWEIGLRDIWLDITARDAFGDDAKLFPSVRFRCGQAAPGKLDMDEEVFPVARRFNFDLVEWPEPGRFGPSAFAYASFSPLY